MFITWQRTVGGAIKGDPRFANTLTWNNFPLPEISAHQRTHIIAAGQGVLNAQAQHPYRTLVDAYNPLATTYPAAYLGMSSSRGRIAPGYPAHLAIFDNEINVSSVYYAGELHMVS